jgi:hypothetical protein
MLFWVTPGVADWTHARSIVSFRGDVAVKPVGAAGGPEGVALTWAEFGLSPPPFTADTT